MKKDNKQSNRIIKKLRSVVSPTIWIVGCIYTVYSHYNNCPHTVILGGWLIGPPLWLILEYRFLFDGEENEWEGFVYIQSLQRNLWLGITTFLAIKYLTLS